jgi:uncharacterized protein YcbX
MTEPVAGVTRRARLHCYRGSVLSVREIWRYPVKSMMGEQLEVAQLGPHGIAGDRAWAVRDEVTGTILTGRREPRLLTAVARLVDARPVIELPDGRHATSSYELSAWLDRPVEFVQAGSTPGTYENPLDVDGESNWVSWQGPTGSFHDGSSTVSLVSTGTLVDFEPARFRINVILDGEGEDALVEHDATIGSVGVHVRKPIDRCIMVARAQRGIAADLSVLKRVIAERNNRMGVGATVYRPGTLSLGERLLPVGA